MARFILTIDGDEISSSYAAVMSKEDALRILAHGGRRFQTQDPNEIIARFADNALGNIIADAIADEQNIAAAAARESVAPIVATPE